MNKGFTLIELLVSMGIIAVLTSMAVFNFNQARIRARDVQRKSDLGQLVKALELYKNDNSGKYPAVGGFQGNLLPDYLKTQIVDPKGSDWSTYQYKPDASLKTYNLMACLENKTDDSKANTTQCAVFSTTGCSCGGLSKTGVMYVISNP